jgi:hypothetical protein
MITGTSVRLWFLLGSTLLVDRIAASIRLCDTSDFLGFPDTWVLQKSQMAFESEGLTQGWDAKEEMGNSHNDGSREHETFTQVSLCTPSEAGCRKLKRIYLRAGPTSRSPATTRTDSNLKARVSGVVFCSVLSGQLHSAVLSFQGGRISN